ncbi:Ribose operon repressor [Baekduia alba]|uniref:LacI family DNA-binding transcriptional regulator n=1 Tax=Baekduia alba TaxID=2997333 RepID=UPI00233F83B4|nr:LacI family DNA-binding transcriptional regulator [Baekduia alba]WCB93413.1 Ribose operon repressor [Baekduia alba]
MTPKRPTSSAAPTVDTVARAAGVSIASVSRVLNGLPASDEVADRVHAAVAEVGYQPNAAARSLKSRRTHQIAFAMENIANPVYVAMVHAIQEVAKERGYQLLLHSTDADADDELALLNGLGRRYVDGLIISPIRMSPAHVEALRTAAAPVVVIGATPDDLAVDTVRVDSRAGAARAVEHLVDTGRRRIAFVNGPVDTTPGSIRRAGYEDGLAARGIALDEELLETADFRLAGGAEAARRILERTRPDAIFCANDLMALGVLNVLREAGLRVPEDVAVVGMDDIDLATIAWPQLSSVSLGSDERGRRAAELLFERLEQPDREPRRELVETSLVVRGSSAAREVAS